MQIGVLTGGGDCPGLNAVIRAVVRRALDYKYNVLGIHKGWAGLLGEGDMEPLNERNISGILPLGGTVLGTSRTNPVRYERQMQTVMSNVEGYNIDALVAIGGDDTLSVAHALHQRGLHVVGVPKTMDNDLSGTDYCVGFDSAVSTVVDALDKLHTTASAHHRVMVVEVMGRDAGWVATYGGLAGGADFIIVPEQPTAIESICQHLSMRRARGKSFSIIVVAEGANLSDVDAPVDMRKQDAFGHVKLDTRGIGEIIAREIENRTGFETRATVLGYLQRGGSPTVFDRILATRVGVAAVDYVRDGKFGYMPAMQGNRIVPVLIQEAIAHTRTVEPELYELAKVFF